ncbi:hypothetical protein KPL78_12415 [Roseomonas sp. HJA6]|uniref:Tail assembly chaperone n=2 Tax=Roseomonas alba TaxID=2846776 RepID=A0ABS7ABH1_9PROT|nr:hypothetical protein [Neoroseomonas alba]
MPKPLPPEPTAAALAAMARRSPLDYPRRVTLTLGDAGRVMRLIDAVPDANGRPFMTLRDAVALAFDVATNVVAAGELDRFRTSPPEPLPTPEPSAALLRWVEDHRAEIEAQTAAAAEAAKKRTASSGKRQRR